MSGNDQNGNDAGRHNTNGQNGGQTPAHSFSTVINIPAGSLPGLLMPGSSSRNGARSGAPGSSSSHRHPSSSSRHGQHFDPSSSSSQSFSFELPSSSASAESSPFRSQGSSAQQGPGANPFGAGFSLIPLPQGSNGQGGSSRPMLSFGGGSPFGGDQDFGSGAQGSGGAPMDLLTALGSLGGGSGDEGHSLSMMLGGPSRAQGSSSSSNRPPPQPASVDPAGGSSSARGSRGVQAEIKKAENESSESKAKKKKEDEEKLASIYEGFNFNSLWDKLSEALSRMQNDSNAAMILLPLIESLMVVSRHVATPEAASALENASARGSVSPVLEKPPPQTAKEAMTQNFFTFTEKHRKILNTMVRANPSLMSGSFSLLVHNPKVLDFDNKRNYFTQQLHKGRREHCKPLNISVRRQYVFAESFRYFARHSGPDLKHGKLNVRFHNEEGVDAGGVTREWFQVLARAMFNPDYALFAPCAADRTTYQPNRASAVNPDHLAFFKFVGRVIGKALYDGRLLDAYFTRSFYKHILGKPVDYRDLEAVDPEYFKSLEWMLQNDITDVLDLTFSVDNEQFGETEVIDLKPNGREVAVTEENKMEYVKLITEQRLTLSIRKQIDAFLDGFHDIIPQSLIRIFSETELELLISGLPDIDVDEWRNNTELHGYSQSDAVITWFWRAVRSFDQETRAKLLQFITGTSKVPLEGFSHLQGVSGDQRTNIHKTYEADRLPAAHTCFNQLDLPVYETFEDLKRNLLLAINEGGEGFGFA